MRALHSRWGTGIFHRENSTGSSKVLLSLETHYTLSTDSKYTKTIPVLEEKKQNLLYIKHAPQNVKVWERRKKTQGQKTGWTLLKQSGQTAAPRSAIAPFSSPCLSPVRSENKKVFCFVCCGFASMQHMADNSASLFILAVFPLPFLSRIQLLPVFQTQCPQHTNQGPHWTVCWQKWRNWHKGSRACCIIPRPRMKERQQL